MGLWGDARVSIEPRANIRVDTTLVLIPVPVTDPLNRFVKGLEKDNFKLFEERKSKKLSRSRAGRAAVDRSCLRLQREHAGQAGKVAGIGGTVFQDG